MGHQALRAEYKPFIRFWLAWSVFVSTGDAWAFGFTDLVRSPAYGYVRFLAPDAVWAMIQMAVALAFLWALFRPGDLALRLGLLGQAMVHLVFGLSILGLTLDGTTSAFSGSTKWWAYVAVPLFLLAHPFRDERVMVHGTDH